MAYSILGVTLIISLITDIRNRKILNIVTFPAMVIGLIYYTLTLGLDGFLFSSGGLLVGFFILLIPFLLGGMGAGDVKLMAAIGALTGVTFVIHSFFYTALFGGIIAVYLIIRRNFSKHAVHQREGIGSTPVGNVKKQSITYPYCVPIALGTLSTIIVGVIR